MRWEQLVQYASLSDIGFRRGMNQDAFVVQTCSDQAVWQKLGHLFVVADGMGGHAVGELASKIAADTVPHTFFKSRDRDAGTALRQAIEVANAAIHERGTHNRDFERMGTTCSSLVLGPQGALVGHVGDSRVYRVRGERIDQLSFDHSLQWELLRQGRLKPEDIYLHEPRHVITRSLGPEPVVQVDLEGPFPVLPGDVYVLCSDGLPSHVNDSEIGAIAGTLLPVDACKLLVNLANLRGGSDNVTVVVVRVGEIPEGLLLQDEIELEERDTGPGRWWLAAYWALAVTFVAGVSLALLGQAWAGGGLAVLAVAAAGGLLASSMRRARREPWNDPQETVYWKCYRTASARLGRRLLSHLAALESELQRTALEESWVIDRGRHEEAYRRAQSEIAAGRLPEALSAYAHAIDSLMAGLQQHRRQTLREAKRARGAPSP